MVLACISLAIFQAEPASADPTLIRVKQDGTGDFTTITAALAAASPGYIIEIQDSATYSEGTIYINVDNIVLRAQAGQTPLVSGGWASSNIILIDADYVTIEGLEVAYGNADLIKQENPHTGTVVRNCIVHDSTGDGDEAIQLKHAVNAIVENNWTYNTREDGVSIADGSKNSVIRNNRIENSESLNGAIYVYYSENIIIEGNYIRNTTAANGIKIYKMENSGTSVVRRNVIVGNNFGVRPRYSQDGNAIQLYVPFEKQNESAQLIIEHNTIDNNTSVGAGHGIYWGQRTLSGVSAATPIHIRNNIISNNKGWGVWTENLSSRPADVAGAGTINYNDVYTLIERIIYAGSTEYPSPGFANQHKVARTLDGTLHVVTWSGPPPGSGTSYIRHSFSRDGGMTWTSTVLNSWSPSRFDSPAIYADDNGNLYMARGYDAAADFGTGGKIYFRKALVDKTDPGSWVWNWQAEVTVDSTPDASCLPDIVVDGNGYIHIVYMRTSMPPAPGQSKWARSTDGGVTWTTQDLYASIPGSPFTFFMVTSIDRDSQNNLYVGLGDIGFNRKNFAMKITYNGGTSWTKGDLVQVSSGASSICQLNVLPDDRICVLYDLNDNNVIFRKTVNPRDVTAWGEEIYVANGNRSGWHEFSLSYKDAQDIRVIFPTARWHAGSDLVMAGSLDGGSTWQPPVRLTDTATGNRVPATLRKTIGDQVAYIYRDGIFNVNPYDNIGTLRYRNVAGVIKNVLTAVVVDNNISVDPLFVNPPNNYRLQAGSPAIDAGMDVGLPYEGSAPDMGAFEFDNTPPAAPSLTSPDNGAEILDNTPTFEWTSVADPSGVKYEIQVDDNDDFSSPVYSFFDIFAVIHTLPDENALALGKYYWRVRAKDGVGNIGEWSEEWNFTVVPIGAIGAILMPLLLLLPFALVLMRRNRRYRY